MTQHKHVGSSLDGLLESDGTLEQVEAEALKRVIVWQIQQTMGHTGVNKSQLAQKMHTSRTAEDLTESSSTVVVGLDRVFQGVVVMPREIHISRL